MPRATARALLRDAAASLAARARRKMLLLSQARDETRTIRPRASGVRVQARYPLFCYAATLRHRYAVDCRLFALRERAPPRERVLRVARVASACHYRASQALLLMLMFSDARFVER